MFAPLQHARQSQQILDRLGVEQRREAALHLDSQLHAALARFSSGLSPISMALAGMDWMMHLAAQPALCSSLWADAQQAWMQGWATALEEVPAGADGDPRFADPVWAQQPWRQLASAQHAAEAWWDQATALRGMSAHHQQVSRFVARQYLDMLSPSNWAMLNPEVMQRTQQTLGANLVDGLRHRLDAWREQQGLPPQAPPARAFQPGVDVAVTPGKVVHRNHLAELIQYLPGTAEVQAEPVFIVPSWIMKYYILDLSPHNSLVRWLVSQGHTVFILSWRNPDESDALLSLDDYLEQGVFDNLAAIARLLPGEAVHACGYCLGGTLLSIAAAAMSRPDGIARQSALAPLRCLSLLAAETDFSEPGEMGVLIDESQVTLIEDMMAERGFLSGPQMAGSFAYLHSRELVWSQRLREFWLGEAHDPNDLMAWNADVTRMPALMHSEYLRRCYLRNELAEGRYPVEGRPVALSDIHVPVFLVGTEKDHVSPWKSVYKLHRLLNGELCFVLASGGHNAGIVSEPGHHGRHFSMRTRAPGDAWQSPEDWSAAATRQEGSWWTVWQRWLVSQGSGRLAPAREPVASAVLGEAPGGYVMQRYHD